MTAAVIPFEPGATLARVVARDGGFVIDTRGPHAARAYTFACPGDTAEFAVALRDEGGWTLRFGHGADEVRRMVVELDEIEGSRA